MADRRHPLRTGALVAGLCLLGAVATVVACLGCITGFAAYMDLHGFAATARIAIVGAVAVAVIPAGIGVGGWLCDRIEAKRHKAYMAYLNSPRHGARTAPRGTR